MSPQRSLAFVAGLLVTYGIFTFTRFLVLGSHDTPERIQSSAQLESRRAELAELEVGDFLEFKGQLMCVTRNLFTGDSTAPIFGRSSVTMMVEQLNPSIDANLAQVGKIYHRAKRPDDSFNGNVNPAWSEAAYRFVTQ